MSNGVILIGCDPEFFLRRKADGVHIPAIGLVPGTKTVPFPLEDGSVQVDGLAVEIGIDPASTFDEFDRKITNVLSQVERMIPDELEFSRSPTVVFDEAQLAGFSDEQLQLGCDPDYNAYTGVVNPAPERPEPGFSVAAGHVHFGIGTFPEHESEIHRKTIEPLVRHFDKYVGTRSCIIDPDPRRRVLYGKAGSYRPKPYGGEYRTPSNGWIWDSGNRKVIFDNMLRAIDMFGGDERGYLEQDVREAIDRTDAEECAVIAKYYK